MLTDLIEKGKCKTGRHEGPWAYASADSCIRVRLCRRCGQVETRVDHRWQPEYAQEGADRYEIALRRLVGIAREQPGLAADALGLQQQWSENLDNFRRYGDTEDLRRQGARIWMGLNRVTGQAMRQSFEALCDLVALQPEGPGRYRVVDARTGRPLDACGRCGCLRMRPQ